MSTKTADKDEETIVPLNKLNNIRPIKPIKNMLYRKFVPITGSRSEPVKEADIKPNFYDKTNQPVCPKIDAKFCRKYDFPAIEYPSFDNPDDPYGINDGAFPEVVYPLAAEDLWYPSRFKPFSTNGQPLTKSSCKCNKRPADTNNKTIKKNLLRSNSNKNTPAVRGNRINRKINASTCKGKKYDNLKFLDSPKQCSLANDVKVPRKYSKNCYVAPSTISKIEQSCKTSPRMSQTTCPPSTKVNSSTVESTYSDTISNVLTTVDSSIRPTPQSNNSDLFTTVDDKITQASPESTTEQIHTITYFTTEPSFITPSSDNITQPSSTITYTTVALLPDITGSSVSSTTYSSNDNLLTLTQVSLGDNSEITSATNTLSETTPSLIATPLDSYLTTSTPYYDYVENTSALASETSSSVPLFTDSIQNENLIKSSAQTISNMQLTTTDYTDSPFATQPTTTISPKTSDTEILPSPISTDEGFTLDPDDLSENPTNNSEASVTSVLLLEKDTELPFDNLSVITSPTDPDQDGYLEPDLLQFINPVGGGGIDDI